MRAAGILNYDAGGAGTWWYVYSPLSRPLELPAIQSESALRLVIGTFDASSLPAIPRGAPWPHRKGHGYMALSIQKGSHNSIRHVRALANNSDACIGINSSP
eukprot:COSAG01_NODE_1095_length_11714_cov_9.062930_8_plen_102_part_00